MAAAAKSKALTAPNLTPRNTDYFAYFLSRARTETKHLGRRYQHDE